MDAKEEPREVTPVVPVMQLSPVQAGIYLLLRKVLQRRKDGKA